MHTVFTSFQVPSMPGNWGMVDLDTPEDAYTIKSFANDNEYQLVWSDEFNVDGRTFYPGDDPYWEAVDLHYWGVSQRVSSAWKMYSRRFRPTTWSGMIQLQSRQREAP